MKLTLVVMAAGMGSRFKGGVKQLAQVGPNGETIMELTINDAIEIGYQKVVFIIRKELKEDFEEMIIPKIQGKIEYDFAYQELDDIPIKVEVNRSKPWGTGQALLSLRNIVKEDFVILNADDYYGKKALETLYNHFYQGRKEQAMVMYHLKNTFTTSNLGNRGVCLEENGKLLKIKETFHIQKIDNQFQTETEVLDPNIYVSMNLFGFHPSVFSLFEQKFIEFLKEPSNLETGEFLIPATINELLNDLEVSVYNTDELCLGITYKEDINLFQKEI